MYFLILLDKFVAAVFEILETLSKLFKPQLLQWNVKYWHFSSCTFFSLQSYPVFKDFLSLIYKSFVFSLANQMPLQMFMVIF